MMISSQTPNSSRISSSSWMQLHGVQVRNLRKIDVQIPLGALTAIVGVSGSGKSSLARETLYAEGRRRFLTAFGSASTDQTSAILRPHAESLRGIPLAVFLEGAVPFGKDQETLAVATGLAEIFAENVVQSGHAKCPHCQGTVQVTELESLGEELLNWSPGTRYQIVFPWPVKRSADEALAELQRRGFRRLTNGTITCELSEEVAQTCDATWWVIADRLTVGTATPVRLRESLEVARREGSGRWAVLRQPQTEAKDNSQPLWRYAASDVHCIACGQIYADWPVPGRPFYSPGDCPICQGAGGTMEANGTATFCPSCRGSGTRLLADYWFFNGRSLTEWLSLTPKQMEAALEQRNEEFHTHGLCKKQGDLLNRLCAAGFADISLQTPLNLLSASERRLLGLISLAVSDLTGALILLDEPFRELHVTEWPAAWSPIQDLLQSGNTVVLVEHGLHVLDKVDWVVELGPGAGDAGGKILFTGPQEDYRTADTLTARIWREGIPPEPRSQRRVTPSLPVTWKFRSTPGSQNAERKSEIPLSAFTTICGPSSSQPSDFLLRQIPQQLQNAAQEADWKGPQETLVVTTSPLSRSSRTTLVSWLKVFAEIRQQFADTAEARRLGWTASQFSFHSVEGGACRECRGQGQRIVRVSMLPEVSVACPTCQGTRYRAEILDVKSRGQSIAEVLAMTVDTAAVYFRNSVRLQRPFALLRQLGLEYLVLGQAVNELSAGERQRLRLAQYLSKGLSAPTLILLEEPAGALHPADVPKLASALHQFADVGHTIMATDASESLSPYSDFVLRANLP